MSFIKTNSVKLQHSAVILCLAALVVSPLYFKVIHPDYKIHVLSFVFIISVVIVGIQVYRGKWSLYSLGFRLDNIKTSYKWYLIATVLGCIALYLYSEIYQLPRGGSTDTFIYYSFFGSIAQEFVYRVYLWKLVEEKLGKTLLNDVVNIITFSGMHIIYDGFWQNYLWVLITLAGTLFVMLYRRKHQNIYLVTGSHIILNTVTVYLGIFH